jgi:hypothetical protein
MMAVYSCRMRRCSVAIRFCMILSTKVLRFVAFPATEYDEVLSGYQLV